MVVQGIHTQNSVRLWLAWTTAAPPECRIGDKAAKRTMLSFQGQPTAVLYEFDGLTAGTTYEATFVNTAQETVHPSVVCRTLPQELAANDYFSVAVGSCYWFYSSARALLPKGYPPKLHDIALRFLLGDQIYIDVFGPASIPVEYSPDVGDMYIKQWGDPDYQHFLSRTPTGVLVDDHDYWNDYPHNNIQLPYLYNNTRRNALQVAAQQGIETYQLPLNPQRAPSFKFSVPPLEFFVLDTRTARSRFDEPHAHFLRSTDRDAVLKWLRNLQGPGVLAIANSLVTRPTPGWQRFLHMMGDVSLADYQEDFTALWQGIVSAPHDILLLTGDVHYSAFGVMDVTTLPGYREGTRRGVVYECISSALGVLPSARSSFDQPTKFDTTGYSDRGEFLEYHTIHAGERGKENFAVLSFRKTQNGVEFSIRYYAPDGSLIFAPQPGAKYILQ
ncbi:MAG: hypothetical protein HY962_08265 [Ignavibacteriae bacterium]|nr:hypothetical protein [Ignavibacteriota bacterium]